MWGACTQPPASLCPPPGAGAPATQGTVLPADGLAGGFVCRRHPTPCVCSLVSEVTAVNKAPRAEMPDDFRAPECVSASLLGARPRLDGPGWQGLPWVPPPAGPTQEWAGTGLPSAGTPLPPGRPPALSCPREAGQCQRGDLVGSCPKAVAGGGALLRSHGPWGLDLSRGPGACAPTLQRPPQLPRPLPALPAPTVCPRPSHTSSVPGSLRVGLGPPWPGFGERGQGLEGAGLTPRRPECGRWAAGLLCPGQPWPECPPEGAQRQGGGPCSPRGPQRSSGRAELAPKGRWFPGQPLRRPQS